MPVVRPDDDDVRVGELLRRRGEMLEPFPRRNASDVPDLEYRTCATSSKADAKAAAERMIGRRETYLSGAA